MLHMFGRERGPEKTHVGCMSLSEIFIMNINEASWLILGHWMDRSIWKSRTLVDHQRSAPQFLFGRKSGSQQRPWQGWNWMGKNKKHRTRCWFLTWSDHVVFHPEKNHDSLGAHVFEASKIHSRQWVILFRLPICLSKRHSFAKSHVTPWRYIWSFNWLWLVRHLRN